MITPLLGLVTKAMLTSAAVVCVCTMKDVMAAEFRLSQGVNGLSSERYVYFAQSTALFAHYRADELRDYQLHIKEPRAPFRMAI